MTLIMPLDGLLVELRTSHSDGDPELQVLCDLGLGIGGGLGIDGGPPSIPTPGFSDGVISVESGSAGNIRDPEDDVLPEEL